MALSRVHRSMKKLVKATMTKKTRSLRSHRRAKPWKCDFIQVAPSQCFPFQECGFREFRKNRPALSFRNAHRNIGSPESPSDSGARHLEGLEDNDAAGTTQRSSGGGLASLRGFLRPSGTSFLSRGLPSTGVLDCFPAPLPGLRPPDDPSGHNTFRRLFPAGSRQIISSCDSNTRNRSRMEARVGAKRFPPISPQDHEGS
ncbi:MAG: hypothetical protein FLDDKLPJ_02821 [Phycisphaerae bacterium]|nr:hypothetical protein [Phycisphaerae bacterium]